MKKFRKELEKIINSSLFDLIVKIGQAALVVIDLVVKIS